MLDCLCERTEPLSEESLHVLRCTGQYIVPPALTLVTEVVLCRLDDQVKFVAQQGFPPCQKPQTGSGTHSTANSMGSRVFLQE